jgi:hypothetical protein
MWLHNDWHKQATCASDLQGGEPGGRAAGLGEKAMSTNRIGGRFVCSWLLEQAHVRAHQFMINQGESVRDKISVLLKHPTNLEDLEDKIYLRELGKHNSNLWSLNHSITSLWGYEGLQPWPPPYSLRASCLSGRSIVLWMLVRGMRQAGRSGWLYWIRRWSGVWQRLATPNKRGGSFRKV